MTLTTEYSVGGIKDTVAFRKLAAFIGMSESETFRLLRERQIEIRYDEDDLRDASTCTE